MLCCVCKQKEATVHLTQIASEKVQKVDLCEDCAKEKGVNDPTGFSLADLLLGLGSAQELTQPGAGVELVCGRCGFTQADFKKTGRLGCADCYATFAEGLGGLLKSMHKGTRHVGKAPAGLRQTREVSERLASLQRQLTKAVQEENFEQAARFRDQIKELNTSVPPTAAPSAG
jgi:protein arginine kinase activator